jgi:Ca2+-binding RTX toxin-like protein
MMLEKLEDRCLLSVASVSRGGTLTVNGTALDDNILITKGRKGVLNVQVNSTALTFRIINVKRIWVDALAGNDTVAFSSRVPGATILGGDGDDHLSGTRADDSIDGGAGNDSLFGWQGNDSITGDDGSDTIDGCDGNDTLRGGIGNDSMSGFIGDDSLFGDDGNDTLFGAAGNDTVDGGAGTDNAVREGTDVFTNVETIT